MSLFVRNYRIRFLPGSTPYKCCNNLNFDESQVINNPNNSWSCAQYSKILQCANIENHKAALTINCSDRQFSYGKYLN